MIEKIENHEIAMVELEKCVLFESPFVGLSQNNKNKIKSILNSDSLKPEHIELLILSYAGGEKLLENSLKDSNYKSSGHVYDVSIYSNIADIFDYHLQNSTKPCDYYIPFIEGIYKSLLDYNKKSKYIWSGLSLFQPNLICNLYCSLLKHIPMSTYQRLDLLMRITNMVSDHSIKFYCYNKFILDQYCNIFPGVITSKQKEEIKDKFIFSFFNKNEKIKIC
ncbi:MAG: hypothetical protein NTU81_03600 [Candidatus Nomurabacteria bacterium]|nr:hypothetical protein [Candidatus Nomurabacteria bacterium]